jgi:glycogen debranching enzyme
MEVTSAGSALALLAPGLSDKQIATARAAVLAGPLASRYGVRSLDREHPERSARNYWRGPVWANITWLAAHGLDLHGEPRAAQALRGRMLFAIEGDGMREYFAPESGRGLGARDFAWTAALCLHALRHDAGELALAA